MSAGKNELEDSVPELQTEARGISSHLDEIGIV
jgi:hypothetical protein